MNRLLIGCALQKEVQVLQSRLGTRAHYLATGLGGPRTAQRLTQSFARTARPDLFIFTGTAGQLRPSLSMGEVVFPEAWCREDGSQFPSDPRYVRILRDREWTILGKGLTVRRPVLKSRTRRRLYEKWDALICDMESAWALETADQFQVPCLGLKVVSDTANSGILSYWTQFDANMKALADSLETLVADLEL